MDVGTVSLVSALLGVVISAGVSYLIANRFGDVAGTRAAIEYQEKQDADEEETFRVSLRDEIDRNIDQVRRISQGLESGSADSTKQETAVRCATKLTEMPPPVWYTSTWKSQTPRLLSAIAPKATSVSDFYANLETISAIRSTLCEHAHEQAEYSRSPTGGIVQFGVWGPPAPFTKNAPKLWADCQRTIGNVLENGNPLWSLKCPQV